MLHLELIPKLRFVNQNTLTPDNNGTSKREDGAGEESRFRANEFCVIAGFLVVIPVFTYNKYHARVYRREHPLIFGVQTVAFAGFFYLDFICLICKG